MSTTKTDCIVIGYNDIDFQSYFDAQKKMAKFSGAYRDAKHNSVDLGGHRLTYMDLLNRSIRAGRNGSANGHPGLNVFETPSLGVTYLTSLLRRRGFDVEMVGFFNYGKDKLVSLLADKPRSVAITTTFYVDHAPIIGIVKFIRQHSPQTKIIVGGPHIYNIACDYEPRSQNHVFKQLGADIYICDSQGEQALINTVSVLRDGRFDDLSRVSNLVYTKNGRKWERTKQERETNDLDDNAVDYTVFRDDEGVFDYPVFMRTARSCPFSCSFCNFPTMAGAHSVSELDVLEKQFRFLREKGVQDLIFIDDTFNVPLPRFKNLLRMMIENEFDFRWMSFFRCSNSDDVAFDLMQESGCQQVFLGIESGDQTILNYMNKYANTERYQSGISKLNERGIVTYASIITGFPGETEETFRNTVQFLEDSKPDLYNLQLYYHDVRTPIHQRKDEFEIKGAGYSWQHKTMAWQDAADLVDEGFACVKSSLPMTLYGFSVWAMPYLHSRGVSIDQLKGFLKISRELLVEGFADKGPGHFEAQEKKLADLFRNDGNGHAEISSTSSDDDGQVAVPHGDLGTPAAASGGGVAATV